MQSEVFRALAGPLMLMLAACASAGASRSGIDEELASLIAQPPVVPCDKRITDSANYADALAEKREQQMMLMRFASEAAMNAYIADTQRLRMESERITMRLDDILKRYGGIADDYYVEFENHTVEQATAWIAAADACADEALK